MTHNRVLCARLACAFSESCTLWSKQHAWIGSDTCRLVPPWGGESECSGSCLAEDASVLAHVCDVSLITLLLVARAPPYWMVRVGYCFHSLRPVGVPRPLRTTYRSQRASTCTCSRSRGDCHTLKGMTAPATNARVTTPTSDCSNSCCNLRLIEIDLDCAASCHKPLSGLITNLQACSLDKGATGFSASQRTLPRPAQQIRHVVATSLSTSVLTATHTQLPKPLCWWYAPLCTAQCPSLVNLLEGQTASLTPSPTWVWQYKGPA